MITHGPPAVLSPWGDGVLKARLDAMEHPPPFHIFGHDHEHFGVYTEAGGRTVALNAAANFQKCGACASGGGGASPTIGPNGATA